MTRRGRFQRWQSGYPSRTGQLAERPIDCPVAAAPAGATFIAITTASRTNAILHMVNLSSLIAITRWSPLLAEGRRRCELSSMMQGPGSGEYEEVHNIGAPRIRRRDRPRSRDCRTLA